MGTVLKIFFIFLIIFTAFVWKTIIFDAGADDLEIYFFDVGQGDSQLILLPGGVKFLVDGGADGKVLDSLQETLRETDRYIDLVFVSHPQLDHFGGLIDVLRRYEVGVLVWNGREGETEAWEEFVSVVKEREVPVIVLGEGDVIRHQDSVMELLAPNSSLLLSSEVNDSSLTALLRSEGVKVLLTGDIGGSSERYVAQKYNVDADVLKVPHHGSKYSSGSEFLSEVTPAVSVIQVGKNRYGHPTQEVLRRLAAVGSSIYRNDSGGTVHLVGRQGVLNIFTQR